MADGARLSGLIGPQTGPNRHSPQDAGNLAHLDPTTFGSFTLNQPIQIRSLTAPAARLRSFFDDYYNRIHISPRIIDFAFVSVNMTREVSVWNAYRGTATLNAIAILNNNQLSIAGPALPRTLTQFQAVRYSLTAAGEGDPAINSILTFSFSDRPDVPRLPTVGMRGRMWDYRPNWSTSVTVDLEYRSDIFTSRSGKEQRQALRYQARKRVDYKIALHRDKLREFERLVARWQTRPIAMGDPSRHTLTTDMLAVMVNRVTVAEVPRWLTVGATVMLESGDDRIIMVVGAVGASGEITFTSPAQRTWPAGTSIRPTISGLLDSSLTQTNLTNELAEVDISFDVTPGSEPVITTAPDMHAHNGREVFRFSENWSESVGTTFEWAREDVDFNYGRRVAFSPTDFGGKIRKSTFLNVSADRAREMSDFFNRMKGQQGEFYWATGLNDLPPVAPLLIGGDSLRVGGRDTFDAFGEDTVYKAVAIRLNDGRMIYRSIIDMYVSQGDTFIQFAEPWLFTVQTSEILCISWMTAARFASDQFTEEWITSEVMQTSLAIKTLEDLPVENPIAPYDQAAKWVMEYWGDGAVEMLDSVDHQVNVAYQPVLAIL